MKLDDAKNHVANLFPTINGKIRFQNRVVTAREMPTVIRTKNLAQSIVWIALLHKLETLLFHRHAIMFLE